MTKQDAPEGSDNVTLHSPQYPLPDAFEVARRAGEHVRPTWDHDYPALAARMAELEARIVKLEALVAIKAAGDH